MVGNRGKGAAYVFTEPGSGSWATTSTAAKLTASGGLGGDDFGDTVSIKEPATRWWSERTGVNSLQGVAYVFTEPNSGWVSTSTAAKLTASDGASGDDFGTSVSIRNRQHGGGRSEPIHFRRQRGGLRVCDPRAAGSDGHQSDGGTVGGRYIGDDYGREPGGRFSSVFWQHGGDQLYQRHGQRSRVGQPGGQRGGGGRDGGYAAWDLREVVGR